MTHKGGAANFPALSVEMYCEEEHCGHDSSNVIFPVDPFLFLTEQDANIAISEPISTCGARFWEDFLKESTRENLQQSATYMNDIENFFQELSNSTTSICTPIQQQAFMSPSLFDFDEIDLKTLFDDSINTTPITLSSGSTGECFSRSNSQESINPALFINENIGGDSYLEQLTSFFLNDELNDSSCPTITASARKRSKSTNRHGTLNSHNESKPKFYSRSGQVADPSRGPCHNCNTTLTCYWRKLKGQYHCNACTLFYKRNNCHRSVDETERPIKRRNRKSKYNDANSDNFD